MDDAFDPYQQWLGIPPAEQPPHYYRLLGLPIFSTDVDRIRSEADQRMRHVRTFQLGKRAQTSQEVLNELASARVCLLNPQSKASYDAALAEWLAAKLPVPPPVLSPDAPPLLEAEPRALLPSDDDPLSSATAATAVARPSLTAARRKSYSGWLIIACVVAITLVALVVLRIRQRPRHGALEDIAEGRPTATLPEVNDTAGANLGGKTVAVPSEVVQQDASGDVHLPLDRARASGPTLQVAGEKTIGWRSKEDQIVWQFLISKPGIFQVFVSYAADVSSAGGEARVLLSGRAQPLTLSIRDTGGRESIVSDPLSPMVAIRKSGRYTLTVSAAKQPGEELLTLRGVELHRAPAR